jgi:hypothetical protein
MAKSDFQSEPPEPRRRRPVKRRRPEDYDDVDAAGDDSDDPVQTVIPYKNVRALLAYYAGVFSWICGVGILVVPVAIVLGILGYRYGQAHPKAKGTGHAVAGIVFGIIGLLLNSAFCTILYMYVNSIPPFGKK